MLPKVELSCAAARHQSHREVPPKHHPQSGWHPTVHDETARLGQMQRTKSRHLFWAMRQPVPQSPPREPLCSQIQQTIHRNIRQTRTYTFPGQVEWFPKLPKNCLPHPGFSADPKPGFTTDSSLRKFWWKYSGILGSHRFVVAEILVEIFGNTWKYSETGPWPRFEFAILAPCFNMHA